MAEITTGRLTSDVSLENIQAQLDRIIQVVNTDIEFGDPQNPKDPTSETLLAGFDFGTPVVDQHNGTPSNIRGSWVEAKLTSAGITDVLCTHNLYLNTPGYTLPVSGEPNCRWLLFGMMHDGTNIDGTSTAALDVGFLGDAVTVNSIKLRFNLVLGGTALTVDAPHPIQVTLFFTRATRGE